MAIQKPSIPKGTRDFTPEETAKRNYIFNSIRSAFESYGFQAIETPALEQLSTLMGKYGDEGDKLLFKVLNSGDFAGKLSDEELLDREAGKLTRLLSEKGLRYDLTVPFARYVVMHRNEIVFPFKRYQIQPVWRADRPQKGRYREFFQCDADIVGSDSLLNEVELLQLLDTVFSSLGIKVCIKLNNRKILAGLAEMLGLEERLTDITVAIDKLDKIGLDNVRRELIDKGIPEQAARDLEPVLLLQGSNSEKLTTLRQHMAASKQGLQGIEELNSVLEQAEKLLKSSQLELDLSLARGLNYYTGCIIEVKALDVEMGSIAGGGRYDNLTGVFGLPGVSGVGVSFGADRIYDVLTQLNLFPTGSMPGTQLLIANFGEEETVWCLPLAAELRKEGLRVEVYPDTAKIKKQLSYADSKNIPFVLMAGADEMKQNKITLKNMQSGQQDMMSRQDLLRFFKTNAI
ncbi:MAG: histidine--tRNA ligase [Bacteroidales bacterium]|nr:histidine--tRNA ligase [Bacteroidales bacterium]